MTGIGFVALGVVLLNLYALVLVLLRAPLYRVTLYRPMLLNIGLSLAPALILVVTLAVLLGATVALGSSVALWLTIALGGGAWLLLLPNSAYLITELNLSHRKDEDPVPLWYDIVLVLTLALSGVINTLASLALAQTIYVLVARPNDPDPLAHPDSWLLVLAVLLLVTFGMYLGRYIRFNSWDVLHPRSFVRKFLGHFRVAGNVPAALGFCLTHTVLLAILYLLLIAPVVSVL